ncbi:MAG: F0F1 ATP synthase subunit A, partial [Acholeplasmatales bacterium]|nr:F0F1 ATP synthase subunit A [Acholeplasmatales bacterium]
IWIVDLINNFIKQNIGIRWRAYAPWFLTLVILLYFSNASAVFFLDNPTGYLVVTTAFAFLSFMVIQISGIASNGVKGYLKGFLDPTPVMLPMNILSEFTLPLSLCLRLFGNVMSGAVISILLKKGFGWFSLPVMPFINAIFDLAFSAIQVAVFVILTIVFASQKISDDEKIYN